jgi:hypothetical protein
MMTPRWAVVLVAVPGVVPWVVLVLTIRTLLLSPLARSWSSAVT